MRVTLKSLKAASEPQEHLALPVRSPFVITKFSFGASDLGMQNTSSYEVSIHQLLQAGIQTRKNSNGCSWITFPIPFSTKASNAAFYGAMVLQSWKIQDQYRTGSP